MFLAPWVPLMTWCWWLGLHGKLLSLEGVQYLIAHWHTSWEAWQYLIESLQQSYEAITVSIPILLLFFIFLKANFFNPHLRIYLLIFFFLRERGRETERKKDTKKHPCDKHQLVSSHIHPNQGSKLQSFGVRNNTPTTWVTQPGQHPHFRDKNIKS